MSAADLLPMDASSDAPEAASLGGALRALGTAVGAALRSITMTFLLHTLTLGACLTLAAYWAASGAGWWRGIAAGGSALALHAAIAPPVLIAAALLATGAASRRHGVARMILAVAADRATRATPSLHSANDLAPLSAALAAAFESIVAEADSVTADQRGWHRRVGRRLAARVLRTIGRVTLRQLDLMPKADGTPPYRTMDQWLAGQIDRVVAESIQRPGYRLLAAALAVQAAGFVGVILAARFLPGIGGAAL